MKKVLYLLVFCCLFTTGIFAEKAAPMNDLMKPETILIHLGKMYISEGIHIYIYDAKNFKLEKKIGKVGEGPREFIKSPVPWFPDIQIFITDKLIVNSHGKVSYFSLQGTYLDEAKTSSNARFTPLEDKLVSVEIAQNDKGNYFSYHMYRWVGGKLEKGKAFFQSTYPEQGGKKVNPILMAELRKVFFRHAYKNRIYIPTYDGRVHVFDSPGKEVLNFMPPYKKVKFTSALEKKYDAFFMNDIRYKMPYKRDKDSNNIGFPGYLALLKDYRVSDDRIYLISSNKIKGRYDSFIYDLQGKLIKNTLLPLKDQDIFAIFPFTITGGKIYQLIENEGEEWELHITPVK
ncbi:MAG: hypothetical protein KAT34_21815 [Candidatus Aminicenantes bacterium]|nr:hypothetical protein [Candidatus Aminicenantes bacterium]